MLDYKATGVDAQKKEGSLHRLLQHVTRTFDLNPCRPLLPIGYYANVIDLRPIGIEIAIAFSTDGVGTKLLVAEMMKKYDTVGIDCIAMNVNDLLCVGATPLSMVDYIAVSEANAFLMEEIARGLYSGCEQAGISLSGGELAQVAELLAHHKNATSFDIVGAALGTVHPEKLIVGQHLKAGDILIGLESNGLHSNGYTLARKICFDRQRLSVNDYVADFGCTVGEELIKPTRIYVKEILEIMKSVQVKGLFHITGDGLFNLVRTQTAVGYHIENFPSIPPVFTYLQQAGDVSSEEMFRVFNMGIGFAIVIPDDSTELDRVQRIIDRTGYKAHRLGFVTDDAERTIVLEPFGLTGRSGSFQKL